MLQYFTPETLEKMYRDLDESRLDLLKSATDDNPIKELQYQEMTDLLLQICDEYENNTGEFLWAKVF